MSLLDAANAVVREVVVSSERERLVAELEREVPRMVQQTVRFYAAVADQLGLHVTDLHCLGALHDEGPSTAGALANRLGLTSGAITRVIDRLVARGFVVRVADPRDRRKVVIEAVSERDTQIGAHFAGVALHLCDSVANLGVGELSILLNWVRGGARAARAEADRLRRDGRPHATRRISAPPIDPELLPESRGAPPFTRR